MRSLVTKATITPKEQTSKGQEQSQYSEGRDDPSPDTTEQNHSVGLEETFLSRIDGEIPETIQVTGTSDDGLRDRVSQAVLLPQMLISEQEY